MIKDFRIRIETDGVIPNIKGIINIFCEGLKVYQHNIMDIDIMELKEIKEKDLELQWKSRKKQL